MQRRNFIKLSVCSASALFAQSYVGQPNDNLAISHVAFPEKKPLITYSNRPPLLETPVEYFTNTITPNELFFVRWHMPIIPTVKAINSYKLFIDGDVNNPLALTIEELKKDFTSKEITAVMQCGGNSRSAFHPTPVGIQWGNGAMGCATFKGVSLKEIIKRAAPKDGVEWISFNGGDRPIKSDIPIFKRELHVDELRDDIIVAYEMNGEDIPFLNGYPLRLIIPGYYADSWVKQLLNITLTKEYQKTFFMDVAYRIPDNECNCETPQNQVKTTKPLTTMKVKSVLALPKSNQRFKVATPIVIKGVAFDGGSGIKRVEISIDGGRSWHTAPIKKQHAPYGFYLFHYSIKPLNKGKLTIMARATNNKGEVQPFDHEIGWNHGGYGYNGIDSVTVEVL